MKKAHKVGAHRTRIEKIFGPTYWADIAKLNPRTKDPEAMRQMARARWDKKKKET